MFGRVLSISSMILVLLTCNASCYCLIQGKTELENSLSVSNQTPICHRTCPVNWPHLRFYKNKVCASSSLLRYTVSIFSIPKPLVLSKIFSVTGAAADLFLRRNLFLPGNTGSFLFAIPFIYIAALFVSPFEEELCFM